MSGADSMSSGVTGPGGRPAITCPCGGTSMVWTQSHWQCGRCGRVLESCCDGAPDDFIDDGNSKSPLSSVIHEPIMDESTIQKRLTALGQGHLFQFLPELNAHHREVLFSQLAELDLDHLRELIDTQVKVKAPHPLPGAIEPVNAYPYQPDPARTATYAEARKRGASLVRDGKVAAFLVAGGQGTRLGYDGPKGEFPVTPIRNKPLFQVFAEQLLAHGRRAGKAIPWYIMTSIANDRQTRDFFAKHNHFGYEPSNVIFFQQGMMPAFSMDGKVLLASKHSLALSPDGHGGSLKALARSGALADMRKRGVEHISYFQVDNPLVHCIDELFLGLHDVTGSEMSSKIIPKAGPLEKVGNFVMGDGVLQVIEYSDLPETLALSKNADGTLRFNAGSIAIHALRVSFVERLNEGGALHLPYHRAEKKVPYVDSSGHHVKPHEPNAVKLEQFVFDAIPMARNAIVYETRRDEEFSPVKNAEGADSPATSRRDQVRRAAAWLKSAGVDVPFNGEEPDCTLEISPLFAATRDELAGRSKTLKPPARGGSVYYE